jgi:lincosamide nucleotidyltransferase A/C/D/E
MAPSTMSAQDASTTLEDLGIAGVRCWVMGGWGVDALLGRATRQHHDLDLLVQVDDLPALHAWLSSNQFEWRYDWDENRPIDRGGRRFATAFVAGHADGRELDIHAIVVREDGTFELATADPWVLPDGALDGRGEIGGFGLRCVSRDAQLAMHVGYELPAHHRLDLEELGF